MPDLTPDPFRYLRKRALRGGSGTTPTPTPANALTLGGQPLTLNGQILTLGAA